MKVAIVEAIWCIGEPVTPNDLFHSFDGLGSLAVIAHHVRELTRMGVLRPVKQRPVRGARETFYFFSRKVWNVK